MNNNNIASENKNKNKIHHASSYCTSAIKEREIDFSKYN